MSHKLSLATVALLLAMAAGPALAQDAAMGGVVFRQRCQSCHSVIPGKKSLLGPNLAGVVGRKAASAPFSYSGALRASGLVWDAETLDKFLTEPNRLVPGTRMVVRTPDPAQRASLIAYLAGPN